MNSSARNRLRKWSCGRSGCDQRPSAVAALLALLLCAAPAQAYLTGGSVPLPKPRPADAPVADRQTPGEAGTPEKPAEPVAPVAEARPAEPPPPSACRLALDDSIAIAPSVPDIKGPGACGGPDMVHLEAVILPDKTRVPLKPGGTMRCAMAAAIADWVRTEMAPLAAGLGSRVSELDNFDSFDCRGRNRVVGAKMSEHGRANALDVRGLKLANGQTIALTDRATPREQREKVLLSMCARFSTVLGPGSDGYHEDHVHVDLAERRGNYKICQWDVWDPLPQVAPLMPAIRPDDAPPREVADKGDGKAEAAPVPAAAQQSNAADPVAEEAVSEPDPPVKPKPRPRKRRAAQSPFSFLR
jgi:hypothetical protein